MFFQEFECQTLKHSPDLLTFVRPSFVCILLKRHLCTSKNFCWFSSPGFPRRFSWTFAGPPFRSPSRELCFFSSPTLGFGSMDVWGLFFLGVGSYVETPPKKKNEAKKDLDEVTCWADGEAILTQMACLAFWSSAKIASWLLTVLDFKFQSGFFSQIPPNAPFFFPWFLQLLSREMFRSGNIRRSCVEKLDKLWCWCLAEQTWYATK